ATITSMFIDNGDNTYTVRFYNNGLADYVTVDRWLPQSGGNFWFADQGQSLYDAKVSLWVPLLEKAYAQLNHSGWSGGNVTNSYDGIYGGWAGTAVSQISGASDTGEMSLIDQTAITAAVTSGQLVCLSTDPTKDGFTNVGGYRVVQQHAYAVLGYDP